ncbi:hypothetical protein L596_019733 [Steinernema carpocapsae]|uniref:Serpentine receptor class gamma n=1 Tax=Steinernema carpocapsae TaxID=34508 RepID=A0A4U5MRM3_STECR|nr:hypothetical protein L596_019733 [Steinernema carpocapsae]
MLSERTNQNILGLIHIVSAVFFTPVLARMVYILIANKEFYKYECYRIIAQQIILHVICGICYIFYGFGIILDSELWVLVKAAHFLCITSFLSIVTMTLVLAFNRFCLICRCAIPKWFTALLQLYTWILFIVVIGIMFSPLAKITLGWDKYSISYDKTVWFSANFGMFRFYYCIVVICAALIVYVLIAAYLIYRKFLWQTTSTTKTERSILIQAGLTFLCNFLTVIVYNYFYKILILTPWSKNAYALFQMTNFMYLPAIVYLVFNRKLRTQVWSCDKINIATHIFVTFSK